MRNNWKITEKIIGCLLILWGGFYFVISIWVFKNDLDVAFAYSNNSWDDLSLLKIIKNYHFKLLLPLITLIVGLLLLLKKRLGWLLSVVFTLLWPATLLIHLWDLYTKILEDDIFEENLVPICTVIGFISLILLTMFGLLMTKQIRSNYNPTIKSWLIMIVLFATLLIDKILIN